MQTMGGGCLCCLCFIFLFILLPMSFSGCEYYEVCLRKRRSTSFTYTDKSYLPGNHFLGPDFFFLPFPLSSQNVEFNDLSIYSKAGIDAVTGKESGGVSLYVDVSFQYKLIPANVGTLYSEVAMKFDAPIRNYARDAIKNKCTEFTADEYLTKREEIETGLATVLKDAIKKGHAELIDLQLRAVDFRGSGPDSFVNTRLRAAIQKETNKAESFKQEATRVRSQTKTEKEKILNQATQAKENAKSEATKISALAKNEAGKMVELARNNGLNTMYSQLGLNSAAHKASLDYLLTLSSSSGINFFVDFSSANAFKS